MRQTVLRTGLVLKREGGVSRGLELPFKLMAVPVPSLAASRASLG